MSLPILVPTLMIWPPFFTLDADANGLLPTGWQGAVATLANGADPLPIITGEAADGAEPWTFAIITGDIARARLPWLWTLYHGAFRDFASERFGYQLYPANRLDATTTLNALTGVGATNVWHVDANPVTGLLFATTLDEDDGGALEFRAGDGRSCDVRPRAGTFVCFDGPVEHRVAPLRTASQRLALPMTYYASATDQPIAYANNAY